MKVPAHVDYLGDLREFIIQTSKVYNLSLKLTNAFKLCIDEAATNIIQHAYRGKEGQITIRAIPKKNYFTIIIIDQGRFFDPRNFADPDLHHYIAVGKKGGLGIFIIKKLMDEIDYYKSWEGNVLKLTKFCNHTVGKKGFILF